VVVDPWFNFRATKYLVQNGFYSFWDWFDDRMSHFLDDDKQLTDTDEQEHGILSDVSREARFTPD
jgi:hypothetical protein